MTRKTRVLEVVYNASNNELVRTNTLVKGAVISIDATPFRMWYGQHFGVGLGKKKAKADEKAKVRSAKQTKLIAKRNKTRVLDPAIEQQFLTGRLLARVSSRPGQSGRCDGYILEGASPPPPRRRRRRAGADAHARWRAGEELTFYSRKMKKN